MGLREDYTNRALAEIGTRSRVVTMAEDTPEARYATLLYDQFRDFLLRRSDYDFAMKVVVPLTGVNAPPWTHAYLVPVDTVRIRGLVPAGVTTNNPRDLPFRVQGLQIVCNGAIAHVIYTFRAPEETWDSSFAEIFTRFLGSGLAFALENAGKGRVKLEEALTFAQHAELRAG